MHLLREFVRALLEDESHVDKLKKYAKGLDIDRATMKRLESAGVVPIASASDSFLGAGAFGDVYECWDEGLNKRVAVKLSRKNDAVSYSAAKKYVETMKVPAPVKRVFPVIHRIVPCGDGMYATVMEILQPLPSHVKMAFFGNFGKHDDDLRRMNIDVADPKMIAASVYKFVTEIVPLGVDEKLEAQSARARQLIANVVNEALQQLKKRHPPPQNYAMLVQRSEFKKSLESLVYGILEELGILQELEDYTVESIVSTLMYGLIAGLEYGNMFPRGSSDIDNAAVAEYSPRDPRVKKLFAALKAMRKSGAVTPRDVHSANVMIRPSTGELVVADVGEFGFDQDLYDL